MKKIRKFFKDNKKTILIADAVLVALLAVWILASPVPDDVSGLGAVSDTYSTAELSWAASDDAKGYRIYRSSDGTSYKYLDYTTGAEYRDEGLRTGRKYYYKVEARNGFNGSGLESAAVVSVVPELEKPELSINTDGGKMVLSFTDVDGATGYEIIRNGEVIDNVEGNSYTDTGAVGDKDYKYEVRAYRYRKSPVYSRYSNGVSAILHAIQDFGVKIRDKNLVVSWNRSEYYKNFKLFNGAELLAETTETEVDINDFELDTVYDIKLVGYADDSTQSPENGKRFKVLEEEMTNEDARLAACEWGVDIAADNSFTYGTGRRAHNFGCYFCGTNVGPVKNKKGTSKVSGHSYAKTYCCNPFVTACYAHGAGDPGVLSACQRGSGFDFSPKTFTKYGNWKNLGKPSLSTLQPGDVICWPAHMMLYIGNNTIVHAKTEGWGAGSITTDSASRYYGRTKFVMRYTGNGSGTKLVIRDVDSKGEVLNKSAEETEGTEGTENKEDEQA